MDFGKYSTLYKIFRYAIFAAILLFLIFPLYWIISISFRSTKEIMSSDISIIQSTFTIQHYIDAFVKAGILQSLVNSFIITLSTVLISVMVGTLMAYIFAKRNFKAKKTLGGVIVFTQFVPMVAYIIPLYLIMSSMKILNTKYSLLITYLGLALPVAIVMLVNYIKDVPQSLEEAASIDGCTNLQILVKIVLPLSLPGIITTAIYVFITVWQEYLVAVSFISRQEAYTVSLALTKFQGPYGTDWGGIMAGAVVISIPAIVLFLLCRKMFTDSISGGVKG